jgi:hypothetical protein
MVLALAMEGTPVKEPYVGPLSKMEMYRDWARRATTPGLTACVDGLSMHPDRGTPETYLADEPLLAAFLKAQWAKPTAPVIANTEWGYSSVARQVGPLRRLAEALRAQWQSRDTPLIASTESGFSPATKYEDPITRQASADLRALLLSAGLGRLVNLYQIMDTGRDPDRQPEHYGLVDPDGAMKLSGASIKRLLDAIAEFQIDGVEPLSPGWHAYQFRCHQGSEGAERIARIYWSTGSQTIDMPGEWRGRRATLIDLIEGTSRAVSGGRLDLTNGPILLLEQ